MQPTHDDSPPAFTDPFGRRFVLQRPLGRGGFGSVWLALMCSPGGLVQRVAVKLLHEGLDPGSQSAQRLRDEAKLLASLHHPVILAAHDLVELGARIALVTEHIEGEDLADCLVGSEAERIPMSAALQVIESVASALSAAYEQLKVVHRDVKPQNIRIGRHGNVKLLDFGIARSGQVPRDARTKTQMMVGSFGYLAPERFESTRPLEPASDVFSLGCVLYEAATGEPLFESISVTEQVRMSVLREQWERFLSERLQHAKLQPPPLRALIEEALSYDPAARPTASEVATRCESLLAGLEDPIPLRRWCKERRWPELPQVLDEAIPADRPHATVWRANPPAARAPEPRGLSSARPTTAPLAQVEAPIRSTSGVRAARPMLLAGGAALSTLLAVAGALVCVVSALTALLFFGRKGETIPERRESGESILAERSPPEEPEIEAPAPEVTREDVRIGSVSLRTQPTSAVLPSEKNTLAAPETPAVLNLSLPTPAGGVGGTICRGEIAANEVLTLPCPEPYFGAALVALQPHLSSPAVVTLAFADPPEAKDTPPPHAVDELRGWPSLPFGTKLSRSMKVREVSGGITHVDPGDLSSGYLGLRISWADVQFVEGRAVAVSMNVSPDASTALQFKWGLPTQIDGDRLEWSGQRVSVQLNKKRLAVSAR